MPISYRITTKQLEQIHSTAIDAYVRATAITRLSFMASGPARALFLKKAAGGNTSTMIEHLGILTGNTGAVMRTSAADVISNGLTHRIDFIAAVIRSIHSDGEQFILTLHDELTGYSDLAGNVSDLDFRTNVLGFKRDLIKNAHLATPVVPEFTAPPMPSAPLMPATLIVHSYAPATQYPAVPLPAVQLGQAIDLSVDAQAAARFVDAQDATVIAPRPHDTATIAAPTPRFSSKAV